MVYKKYDFIFPGKKVNFKTLSFLGFFITKNVYSSLLMTIISIGGDRVGYSGY